ncbi:MAG: heavy metal translocating P-type ATPase [Hyphomonadaceae bacterium]|nr:heavy metal translocating P-type ATPase [Hyphomonadaceae bacterium]
MNATAPACPSGLSPPSASSVAQDPTTFVLMKDGVKSLDLVIKGASCGGCLSKVENGVSRLPGVRVARLNLSTARLRVEWEGQLKPRAIVEAIAGLGYGVTAFDPGKIDAEGVRAERRLLTALAVAGVGTAAVMFLSEPLWFGSDLPDEARNVLRWLSAAVALPVTLVSGRPFFLSAISSIRRRRLNMDVPVSLAVILALALSLYETITGGRHAFFDAAVMLLFFLLIGRVLDARLRRRAYAAANELASLQTATATRLGPNGRAEAVRAADIRPGDMLLVAAGERLVVDAEVVSGESEADLRLVTGEVEPAPTHAGRTLHAGAVSLSAPIRVRALAAANDSLMADIARLLEAGEQKKSSYRRLADKAAELYVPQVHATAALGFVGWLIFGASAAQAAYVAVTVLIITCPCALALAAPLVQVVAAGKLFREGIYLSSGDALERLAAVDHVVLDKTGTLTLGDPVLHNMSETARGALDKAAKLARTSHHPFSRALVKVAGAGPVAEDVRELPGRGVTGMIGGLSARLGSASFVGAQAGGGSEIWFAMDGAPPVVFYFDDAIRPDAVETIAKLKAMGMEVELLSGDGEERVARAATAADIVQWRAGVTPQAKARRIMQLEADGKKILMVGDGLNDAGALAGAHASIAPGGAVDVSRLASDCVFSGDSLRAIAQVVAIARTARIRMRENFALASLYNVVVIPVALAGWVTPLIAAIAMSASSAVVTLNALRLTAPRPSGKRGVT